MSAKILHSALYAAGCNRVYFNIEKICTPRGSGADKMGKRYEYDAKLHENPDNGGAYVIFPYDLRAAFGRGRVKVHASFDGIDYDGSVVNMGLKNPDGSVCYVIGVLKAIRQRLGKKDGDTIHVTIEARED